MKKIRKLIRKTALYLRYTSLRRAFSKTSEDSDINENSFGEILGNFPRDTKSDLIIYSVADSLYFDRFGKAFIGSMIVNAENHALHLHLYNPREDQLDYLSQVASTCNAIDLSYTWTKPDVSQFQGEDLGRYICFTRYIHLYELHKSAKTACLIMDIDALLVRNIENFATQVSYYDLSFYARFNKFYFDTKMLGGAVYIKYNDKGRQLLSCIKSHLAWFVNEGYLLEKLDQIVVYDIYRRMSEKISFYPFGDDVLDLNFTGDSIIWYPKGSSRNEDLYNKKLAEFSDLT